MTTKEMKAGGVVVFWSAAESNRDVLGSGLKELGLEQFTPEERTPFAVLKDSLEAVYASRDHLIRATEDDDTYEVVKEVRQTGGRNAYHHLISARVTCQDYVEVKPYDANLSSHLQTGYELRRKLLHSSSVTSSLVSIVHHLKGTPMRPHGGMYWLADEHDTTWQKIGEAFEKAGSSRVYTMRIKFDADMVRAVSAAITSEITAETDMIRKELDSGDLGKRACETRVQLIKQLAEKLAAYEDALGCSLGTVKDVIDKTHDAAAQAVLMKSVAAEVSA